ncbi:MAG: alpha/beta fold hydrolase [Chitinophagaceae bacterium]|nr:alpha/beta fold hydrolase [Chitinophagaceae bacterium]
MLRSFASMKLSQRIALRYIRTKFRLLSAISKRKAAEKAFELFCTPQYRNKKKLPKIFESAENLQLKVESSAVKGWRWNAGGERKVLIIHGYESSAINFDRYVKPLIKKGYEVLAFDAPGHGRSGGKQINAPLYRSTIKEINKRFGPVKSFMAHSFGGLAVSLALEETSHTSDYRLVLIAPATETVTAIDSFFSFLKLDPAIRPEFEKIIIRRSGVSPDWFSVKRAMKHIKAQVLWVHDEDDEITPLKDVLELKNKQLPNMKFVITKGLGHRRIYRDNKVTRQIVDFL